MNYTGNLYHNGNLIAPAEDTWQFTDPLGGIGEGDDTVGDTLYGNVTLLLHSNYHPVDTDIIDHSTSPLPVTKNGDAAIAQEVQAVAESGDTNWTDVDLSLIHI